MTIENYHKIALGFGWEFVSDLKINELGKTDFCDDAIQVGGNWYYRKMPKKLIDAEKVFFATLKATPWTPETAESEKAKRLATRLAALAQLNANLAARDEYRLIRKGRPDGLESQRFMFPEIATGPQVHPVTGVITDSDCPKTISIPWYKGLKHAQRFPHRSPEWLAWYSMRNVIEAFNSHIKDSNWEAIDDAGRRRARGNTFMYLATTMAVVSANVRKIHTFLMDMRKGIDKKLVSPVESVDSLSDGGPTASPPLTRRSLPLSRHSH